MDHRGLRTGRRKPDARRLRRRTGRALEFLNTPEGKRLLGLPAACVPVAPLIIGHPEAAPPVVPRNKPPARLI